MADWVWAAAQYFHLSSCMFPCLFMGSEQQKIDVATERTDRDRDGLKGDMQSILRIKARRKHPLCFYFLLTKNTWSPEEVTLLANHLVYPTQCAPDLGQKRPCPRACTGVEGPDRQWASQFLTSTLNEDVQEFIHLLTLSHLLLQISQRERREVRRQWLCLCGDTRNNTA